MIKPGDRVRFSHAWSRFEPPVHLTGDMVSLRKALVISCVGVRYETSVLEKETKVAFMYTLLVDGEGVYYTWEHNLTDAL